MKKKATTPECYFRDGKRARKGSMFCCNACAAEWAEELAKGNEEVWCIDCQDWVEPQVTGHDDHEVNNWNGVILNWK